MLAWSEYTCVEIPHSDGEFFFVDRNAGAAVEHLIGSRAIHDGPVIFVTS